MKVNLRKFVALFAGVVVGNVVAERYILKAAPDSPSGFVLVSDGIGLDEGARALTVVSAAWALDKALALVWK